MQKLRCILIWRTFQLISLSNLLSKFPSYCCLHFTKNTAHHIPEMLTYYAGKVLAMGRSGNSRVFNFTILVRSQKNRYTRNIHVLQQLPVEWVVGCWRGYLSGARCRLAYYGPADATATHCLLLQQNPGWIGTGLVPAHLDSPG